MGKRWTIAGMVLVTGIGMGPIGDWKGDAAADWVATSRSTSAPVESSTSRPSSDGQIRELIRRLAAASYRERDAAQRRLTELGDAALPTLIEFADDPNPEIAIRVSSILRPPADPSMRVRLALAWIRTQKSELVEKAVYMVFDDAEHCDAAFIDAAKAMKGPAGRGAAAVAERMAGWRRQYEVFLKTYEKARRRNLASAEALLKTQVDSKLYQAEAAFWEAMEAIDGDSGEGGAEDDGPSAKVNQAQPASGNSTTRPGTPARGNR